MFKTVHYRSVDPIQNLKIKITLCRKTGLNTGQNLQETTQDEKSPKQGENKRRGLFGKLKRRNKQDEEDKGTQEEHDDGEVEAKPPEEQTEEDSGAEKEAARHQTEDAPETEERLPPELVRQAVIGWQQKIHSSREVARALADELEDGPRGLPNPRDVRRSQNSPKKQEQLRSLANASLQSIYRDSIRRTERYSSSGFEADLIFTYTNADEFSERDEMDRTVTTSRLEHLNPLVAAMRSFPQQMNQVLRSQVMYIMADCGERAGTGEPLEKPLAVVKAYPDGSFSMRPGFNRKDAEGNMIDDPFEFEDENGAQWQYTIENAAKTCTTAEEKRTEQLMKEHSERARMLRKPVRGMAFERPPGISPDALRLVFLGEIVAARDFPQDHLWVEYSVHCDPDVWDVQGSGPQGELRGATQVSQCVRYPGDPGIAQLPYRVAHFSHPIELQFVSQGDLLPSKWPVIYFQVNTYDAWGRYTVQGYTWLSLHCVGRGGCSAHSLATWRPLGSVQDRLHGFFVGGSAELKDMTYAGVPRDFQGGFLSKFGFKSETSGTLKVRAYAMRQQRRPDAQPNRPRPIPAARSPKGLNIERRRQLLDLRQVVDRARRRLEEVRGGSVVVRGEALEAMAHPPELVKDAEPQEWEVEEGGMAGFSIRAKGRGYLRYSWHFNGKPLEVETADTQSLFLRDVQQSDQGEYFCVVANADGKVTSRSARLIVVPSLGFLEQPDPRLQFNEGQTATVSVKAKGKAPLSYQWQKDGKPLRFDESCTSPDLVISDLGPSDSGLYRCEISNEGASELSEPCRLHVAGDSQSQKVSNRKAQQEAGGVEGSPSLDGEDGPGGASTDDTAGQSEAGQSVGASAVERGSASGSQADAQAGPVHASGSEGDGNDDDDDEEEEEGAEKPMVVKLRPRDATVHVGESVEFRVTAVGTPPLQYQWMLNGTEMPGEQEPQLALMSANAEDSGEYSCRVSNRFGEATSEVGRLHVEGAEDAVRGFEADD
uniref:Meckel syndrome type 1 protein n=2 Tax=Tetraselmis sp. GSL018 TaxID=582737 RepID=A0A061RT25_9CHLO|eukprot:CAMPEP_0177616316 /NCGR_PEP_ID=MMETSP0419_2-20121207/24067_1 /TAXON_ID=582737 /ORGANISM="Tetraselmis sp., Strain GSL018" /LENGTH=993 /DNA_ID=CAMNT_0019114319 /DNA_START=46 /DNA_END=3027 /DNA_ORIENTATION=-